MKNETLTCCHVSFANAQHKFGHDYYFVNWHSYLLFVFLVVLPQINVEVKGKMKARFVYSHQCLPFRLSRQPPVPPELFAARRIGEIYSFCSASGKGIMEWDGRTFAADQRRAATLPGGECDIDSLAYGLNDSDENLFDSASRYFHFAAPECFMDGHHGHRYGVSAAQHILSKLLSELEECVRLLGLLRPDDNHPSDDDVVDIDDRLGCGRVTARLVQSHLISRKSVLDLLVRVRASSLLPDVEASRPPWYLTVPFSFDPCEAYEFNLACPASGRIPSVAFRSVCSTDGSPVPLRSDTEMSMDDTESHVLASLRARLMWTTAVETTRATKSKAPSAVAAKAEAIDLLDM